MPKPIDNNEAAQQVMLEQDVIIKNLNREVSMLKAFTYIIIRDYTKCSMHKPITVSHDDIVSVTESKPVFLIEPNNEVPEKSTGFTVNIKRED